MRSITCINHANGKSIEITENSFSPLFLASIDGIYKSNFDVAVSNNTMIDGGVYQGSRANVRNIVITALDQPNNVYNQETRDIIYNVFRNEESGTLIYHEDGVEDRQIDYYTESVTRESGGHRLFTISLICPEPRFSDVYDNYVYMAGMVGNFEFEHEFREEGEEIGIYLVSRLVNIVNDTAVQSIGFTAVIETLTTITNPSLTRVESGEHIQVGYTGKTLTMHEGDVLTITTEQNNKHVRFTHNGVTTEINEYLTNDSEFFNLLSGDNHIVYNASSGVDTMKVLIRYKFQYGGA